MFVTFEGGEGAGKTTLIQALSQALLSQGIRVMVTREPGGTALGEEVRAWLLQKDSHVQIHPRAELLLFLAARLQHLEEKILPALARGEVVFCDRFNDSTIAYQGAGRDLGVDYVRSLCDLACRDFTPDLTFFLDIDPAEGLTRTRSMTKKEAKRGEVDRIEGEELTFHQRVRHAFHTLASEFPQRIHVIQANRPREQVFEEALKILERRSHGIV